MGWLNCDGRLVSTEEYALLFRVIGYSFGGSGDQFRLPDMRSRVPGAISQGTGLTLRALGDSVGAETHTLTIAEMPSHNHGTDASDTDVGNNQTGNSATGITVDNNSTGITDLGHDHSYTAPANGNISGAGLVTFSVNTTGGTTETGYANINDPTHNHTITDPTHYHSIATQGGDDPHNNMQPTLFLGNMFMYSGRIHGATSKWRYELNTNIL